MSRMITKASEAFRSKFNTRAMPRLFRAPGRVNLIGDHTDYNDGFVLPAAINRQIVLAATPRDDSRINVHALNYDQWDRFDILKEISPLPRHAWGNYVRGVVWALRTDGHKLRGMDAVIAGDIPIGAGLSSSAALEVVTGFTLLCLSGAEIRLPDLAIKAQKAEHDFVGMHCGIMDQFIVSLGQADHALLIDCRHLTYKTVPLPSRASIVIVDSGVHRGLKDMEYNLRRKECETAVAHFGVDALRDIDSRTFQKLAHGLSDVVRRRARHVISENERTVSAATALENVDLRAVGNFMKASHDSLKDDFEVSCPEQDLLVEIALGADGVYGARLTGAGFGGCVVVLAEQQAAEGLVQTIETSYRSTTGKQATAYICNATDGVSEIEIR